MTTSERVKHRTPRFIKIACVLTLVSLALISFAIVHPAPLAVIAAMSIGQGIGTIGFVLFGLVALRDIKPIFRNRKSAPPPAPISIAEKPAVEAKAAEEKAAEEKPAEEKPAKQKGTEESE